MKLSFSISGNFKLIVICALRVVPQDCTLVNATVLIVYLRRFVSHVLNPSLRLRDQMRRTKNDWKVFGANEPSQRLHLHLQRVYKAFIFFSL